MRPLLLALACVASAGCDVSLQRMVDQERCERDEATPHFRDGLCNRPRPPGVVPATHVVPPAPPAVTRDLVMLGRMRFATFCAPCHGPLGDGRSQVAENMSLRAPPSLHEPRIVALSDEALFARITHGFGLMPPYGDALPAEERWAVVAYVRVLERSQATRLADLPLERQAEARRALP